MKMKSKMSNMQKRAISIFVLILMTFSLFGTIPAFSAANGQYDSTLENLSIDEIRKMLGIPYDEEDMEFQAGDDYYPEDIDLGLFLTDYSNEYYQTYQPWKTKAAVRCIELSDDFKYMVVGGGYLYDNEIHIYRWNTNINQYSKVWNSGDGVIKADVTDVDIADTDHNDFLEIVASSVDGHWYAFEQQHIYDPNTNTENMFQHVYTSPYLGQVWSIEINDTDLDYDPDVICVSWDYKVHVFEYTLHSGYPFSPEHWIEYTEKWTSHNLRAHPTSLAVGDTNYNGLPDFVVGTREGEIFVFENNGTVLDIHGQPWPLCQDNSYKLIYQNNNTIWKPIYSMEIGNLDNNPGDEVVIASFAFNGYILRYDMQEADYYLQKLIKYFEPWTQKDYYPTDDYIDWGISAQNAYLSLDSEALGTTVQEPLNFSTEWYYKGPYPYDTGAAQLNYTTHTYFVANDTHSSWEVYDYGADEGGTGNGNEKEDVVLDFRTGLFDPQINFANFEIQISYDLEHWLTIPETSMSHGSSGLNSRTIEFDVDEVMNEYQWKDFRYINVTVLAGVGTTYKLTYSKLNYVDMRVSTALCASVGTLASSVTGEHDLQALLGTVDGRIVAFIYDETVDEFILSWDSWVDDRFTLGTNIWDLEQVKTLGTMPMIYGWTFLDTTEYVLKPDTQPYPQIRDMMGDDSWIYDYDIGYIDADPSGHGDFVVSTQSGNVYFFDRTFDIDIPNSFNYFNLINSYVNYDGFNLTVSLIDYTTAFGGPELFIGTYDPSISNVYDDWYDDTDTDSPANLHIWNQVGMAYNGPVNLYSIESTGQLEELLKNAQSIPSADGVDMDGDGDMDIVVCIDGLYLLWNIGSHASPEYVLDADYFTDVNAVQGRRKFMKPKFVEFDHDGDYDLTLGYSNRVGATYFDNFGTATNPKWEEKKELLNNLDYEATINVYNLTRPLFVSYLDHSIWSTLQMNLLYGEDFTDKYALFYMFDVFTNDVHFFYINYDTQTSYMVATYPLISRLEINSFRSETVFEIYTSRNFGFRAIESWSTALELLEWTMTVETADLDEDGSGEIIVGDYDNNIYIFEHMLNNTYKRAFRSPDVVQYYATDETPYAWDQFGGYTGEFNQTIWNHVSHILVDVDLDGDGYLELVALAGTVFYIFEVVYDDFSGKIIDDTYQLVHRFDCLRSDEGPYMIEAGLIDPVGLTWAKDLDHDGYSEILVAFESQLFVYEPYSGEFYEVFGQVDTPTGHYNLAGNSRAYPDMTIAGILVADTNQNGWEEIIIYGEVDDATVPYDMGYVAIIETNIHGYQIIWQAPVDVVASNKIYTVEIADQDYDGQLEVIIGGEKGISIWEYQGDADGDLYVQINVITGHMNYPIMPSNSLFGENSFYGIDNQIRQRSHDVIQYVYGTSNHSYIAVWTEWYNPWSIYVIYQAMSPDGQNWLYKTMLPIASVNDQLLPSLTQTTNGDLYLIWTVFRFSGASGNRYGIPCLKSTDFGDTWTSEGFLNETELLGPNPYRSPTVFAHDNDGIGYSFVFKNSTHSIPYYGWHFSNGTNIVPQPIEGLKEFNVNGIDIVGHPNNSPSQGFTFAGAMSANRPGENKDDYDIWFFETDISFNLTIESRKLVESPAVEHTPSIAYILTGTNPLLISYDAAGYKQAMPTAYGLVSSDYFEWSEPDILNVYPDYLERNPITGAMYFKYQPSWSLNSHGFRAPKVTATYDGKFVVLTKLDIKGVTIVGAAYWEDFLFQEYSLTITDFTAFGKATDIAVGDTDGDGLNEILAADGPYARLFEIFETTIMNTRYQFKWKSQEYQNPVSDVSIYDTNGNGFPEIIFSVQGEDVYVFEVLDLSKPIVDLQVPIQIYKTLESNTAVYLTTTPIDLNDDGITDYVCGMDDNMLHGILGNNGTVLWSTDIGSTTRFTFEGLYNYNSQIIVLDDNNDILWINKRTGIIIDTITTGDSYVGEATIYDINGDGYGDIISKDSSSNEIRIYSGVDGDILELGADVAGAGVLGIDVAFNSSIPLIVASLTNDTIVALDISLNVLWTFAMDTVTYSQVYVKDLDADSYSEIFIPASECVLLQINGSILWNISTPIVPNQVVFYDINEDGILDLITTGGESFTGSAYDGETGLLLWSRGLWKYVGLEVALGTVGDDPVLYYPYYDINEEVGVLCVNIDGSLKWVFETGIFPVGYAVGVVATEINGQNGVIFSTYGDKVIGVTSTEFIPVKPSYVKMAPVEFPSEMEYERMFSGIGEINPDTVVVANFNGLDYPTLFYIENNTHAVWCDIQTGEIYSKETIMDIGNIVKCVAADPEGKGYPTSVYFYTDLFYLGVIHVTTMEVETNADLVGKTNSIHELLAYSLSGVGGDNLIITTISTTNVNYIRVYKPNAGDQAWFDSIGEDVGKQLLAGNLKATENILVVVSDSTIIFYLKDGTADYSLYSNYFGRVAIGYTKTTDTYKTVFIHEGFDIQNYNVEINTFTSWEANLETDAEIFDMVIGEMQGDAYYEVYVTQSGTGIMAFDVDAKLLWSHTHSSFLSNKLILYKDPNYGDAVLLATDYHRVFMYDSRADIIREATVDLFDQILFIGTSCNETLKDEGIFVFLAGNTFYGHNLESVHGILAESIDESTIDWVSLRRIGVPALVMLSITIAAIVLISRKSKVKV